MHKIKELLHKDNEDTNVNTTTTTEKHGLFHPGGNNTNTTSRDGELLSNRQFEQNHMHHGEIEHGGQQHFHGGEQWQGGERHIVHEREVLRDGGDLGYRSGVDPTMNRSIETATSHSGGVSREIIDEGKIVKESIKEVELHKVQPVIHRNREQKEIRHVVEPHQKFEVKNTTIDHREREIDLGVRREASTLETSRSLGSGPNIQSSREFLGTDREHQELPARVEEHVHRKVEEHVHPVIYKEVLKPRVTEETHHIYETVKETPVETYEVKGMARPRGGDNLMQAEREFINRESSRGMVLGEGHNCSRDQCLGSRTGCSGGRCQYFDNTGNSSWRQSGWTSSERSDESFRSGGNQFLGNQNARGLPLHDTHNSAYDAALCNQCTNNSICSHSARDADRMAKMNEKKIMKDQKLAEKQMHKREKFEDKNRNVNVV